MRSIEGWEGGVFEGERAFVSFLVLRDTQYVNTTLIINGHLL